MGEVSPEQVEMAYAPQGNGQTEDVMRGLGDRDRLAAIDESIRECAQLRQAPGHRGPDTRGTRAQGLGELLEHGVRDRGNDASTDVRRLPIVAAIAIDPCEGKARVHLEENVVEARGQGEGALAGLPSHIPHPFFEVYDGFRGILSRETWHGLIEPYQSMTLCSCLTSSRRCGAS